MALPVGSQLQLNKIPVLGLVPESSATGSAPGSPVPGQLWYDSTVGRGYIYESGAWQPISAVGSEQIANKGQANGYASLDGSTKVPIAQLPTGTSGTTVALGNDSRFTDSRAPSGSAGGDLTGSYPNPTVAALAITDAKVAAANKDGIASTPSLRTLGTGAQQALAGNTRLDTIASPTGPVNLNSQRISNLAPSTTGTDAVNRNELDSARQGFAGAKDPVQVAMSSNVNIASPGATLDGVTMATGDRVLLVAQTTGTQNGIYVWNGAAAAMTRAVDADSTGEILDGTTVAVAEGAVAGSIYVQTATPAGAPGSWTQTWTQFNTGGTAYSAGAGLVNNSNTFDVVGTANRITANADSIDIASNYAGQTSITTLGTVATGTWNATTIALNKGGTGATTAPAARTALGAVGKYNATLGALVAGVETTITHSLGSTEVQTMFRDATTNFQILLAWRVVDANTVGVTADVAYSASAVKAVVMG